MSRLRPAILCGGSGTRLWPLSRKARPKQFHPLVTERTLLGETIARALQLDGVTTADLILISGESLAALVREELDAMGASDATLIIEPSAKNTAPAAAVAALVAREKGDDNVILLLPSDHHVGDEAAFAEAIAKGAALAERDYLVTFGITPDSPHTGYGYILRGAEEAPGYRIARFREKPDRATAEKLISDGGADWNSGIYMFKPGRFLDELAAHAPSVSDATERAYAEARKNAEGLRPLAEHWNESPSISIDKAVAEKTAHAATVPADMKWNDVGGWAALWDIAQKDDGKNVLLGDVVGVDIKNCYVRAGDRLVALIGLEDIVVVETADAVCIAPRDRAEDVKAVVEALTAAGRKDKL